MPKLINFKCLNRMVENEKMAVQFFQCNRRSVRIEQFMAELTEHVLYPFLQKQSSPFEVSYAKND